MNAFRKSLPALGGVIVGAMLVSFAFPALGRDDPPRALPAGAHAATVKAFSAKSAGLKKLRYISLSNELTAQPSAESGASLVCPKGYHAISGFYGPTKQEGLGQLALTNSFPAGKGNRSWDLGVKNLSAVAQTFFVGLVCIK
jgi:hypothetical protein